MHQQSNLLLNVLVCSLITYCGAILTKNNCNEVNSHVTCECQPGQQELNITTFQLPNIHNTASKITVQNCQKVYIGNDAIKEFTNLRQLLIQNIQDLNLRQGSLQWSGYKYASNNGEEPAVSITIRNTNIKTLPPFTIKDKLDELHLEYVHIAEVQAFAVSSVSKVRLIEIKNSKLNQIDAQAFKKVEVKHFAIINSTFGTLPSRAFSELGVTETFKITNSDFGIVRSGAFKIDGPHQVEIYGTKFEHLENQAFQITAKKNVEINNNHFTHVHPGAFSRISVSLDARSAQFKQELLFKNNSVNDFNKFAFDSSFSAKYGVIVVNKSCECAEVQIWIKDNEWKEHIVCLQKGVSVKAVSFVQDRCKSGLSTWVIVVVVLGVLLVLLSVAIAVIVFVYRRIKQQKRKEYINRSEGVRNGTVGMIIPDGRTYRETELHVIVEKAELLTTEL